MVSTFSIIGKVCEFGTEGHNAYMETVCCFGEIRQLNFLSRVRVRLIIFWKATTNKQLEYTYTLILE